MLCHHSSVLYYTAWSRMRLHSRLQGLKGLECITLLRANCHHRAKYDLSLAYEGYRKVINFLYELIVLLLFNSVNFGGS